MPNLIRQITFERPTPQRIDWAVPLDVDPLVATWTAVFYTERNRTIRAPERRRIDHGHYFGDANNGPSTISEPSFAWCEKATEPYIINTIMPPVYEVPAEYRAPDPKKLRPPVTEPQTDWLEKYLAGVAPFDPSIYQGIQDELRVIRTREPKKLYGAVDEPEQGWLWKDTVEPFITSTIIPAIYETPAEYRTREALKLYMRDLVEPLTDWLGNSLVVTFDPSLYVAAFQDIFYRTPESGKVKLLVEPETDWLQSSLVVTFDPSIYIAAFQDYSLLTPNSLLPQRLPLSEPEFIWRDLFDFMRWPAIEQMLTRAYRASERSKIFAPSITEPWAAGNFEAADNFISLYAPTLWTPKDRAPEGQKLKVIYGPDDSPWIYPQTVTIVTFDSALWPAIEEQLRAFRTIDRKKIETWLSEPEFTWQYLVNDARNAVLFPATVEPSFRTRDRAYLELRKMYLSDYGWLTLNIPAPPAIATGVRHKRKWRRSG